MSIVGIGTDIVSVKRIEALWQRFGLRFARRILSEPELEQLQSVQRPIAFLAKRYAAKEAAAKAFGTGFRPHGIQFTEMRVHNDELGRPHLAFSGKALAYATTQGIQSVHLSLSDEKAFAIAFVIFSTR